MPYDSIDEIKKAIISYLEKNIECENFDVIKLKREFIYDELTRFPKEKLKEALKKLEEEREILTVQSNGIFIIPYKLRNESVLKQFKFQEPFQFIKYIYLVGFVLLILLFYLIKSFQLAILTLLDFSKTEYIIANSAILGMLFPIVFGAIIYFIYRKVEEFFLKMKKIVRIIIITNFALLIIYMLLKIIIKDPLI